MNRRKHRRKKISISNLIKNIKQLMQQFSFKQFSSLTICDENDNPVYIMLEYKQFENILSQRGKTEELELDHKQDIKNATQAQLELLKLKGYCPFFNNLSDEEIIALTSDVKFMNYDKDEIVFGQLAKSEEIYMVLKGAVDITIKNKNHEPITLAKQTQGKVFGEMAYLTKDARNARATAVQKETVLLSFKIVNIAPPKMECSYNIMHQNFIYTLSEKLLESNQNLL